MYNSALEPGENYSLPLEIVETDIDLYYHFALTMYQEIEKNNSADKETVFILPVGPVFQYARFFTLLRRRPLDLSRVQWFFMDEYLKDSKELIDPDHPLSFRGFIYSEFSEEKTLAFNLNRNRIYFPDPAGPGEYDRKLADLGGADICFAGIGINGHLAFNEPPESEEERLLFRDSPSRIVALSRETRTINSNTALGGAYEAIPLYAVTVGFSSILKSDRIRVYLNRPWQRAVVRKILFGEISEYFPASLLREHRDAEVVLTAQVAEKPCFGLR